MIKKFLAGLVLCCMIIGLIPGQPAAADAFSIYKGIDYSPVYDVNYYMTLYPELNEQFGGTAAKYIEHFVNIGMVEGRVGKATFDPHSYRRAYADLRMAFGMDMPRYYMHYITTGMAEGRNQTVDVFPIKTPVTQYKGIDFSPIYNFDFYINANPDVKSIYGDDDVGALKHYLSEGILEGKWAKLYPDQTMLARAKSMAPVIDNEVTAYKGVDVSPVYDSYYYLWNNPDVAQAVGYDPVQAMEHFVKHGMSEGRAARAVYDPLTYGIISGVVNKDTIVSRMAEVANQYDTDTDTIILVNKAAKHVSIFTGRKGNYSMIMNFPCAIGANSSPTPSGVYKVGIKGLYFNTGTAGRCWYYTQIKGNYLFHSQIYDRSSKPVRLIDSRMGIAVSHGCIRLHLDNAKWIYDNVPKGSTIVVY